jgi:hypothetical protein
MQAERKLNKAVAMEIPSNLSSADYLLGRKPEVAPATKRFLVAKKLGHYCSGLAQMGIIEPSDL